MHPMRIVFWGLIVAPLTVYLLFIGTGIALKKDNTVQGAAEYYSYQQFGPGKHYIPEMWRVVKKYSFEKVD